jgi:hypothetical protein
MPLRIVAADKPKRKGRSFRNTRRENRLEELGRVDAEKAYTSRGKRNLRDEKHRIRTELKSGGPAGKTRGKHLTGDDPLVKWLAGGVKGKPHSSKEGREAAGGRKFDRLTKRMRRPSPGPQARPPRKSDYKSPGRPGGKGPKPDKRPKKKYMTPLKSGGSAKKPRPHGPHLWVRGGKREGKAIGGVVKGAGKAGKRFLDFIKTGKHVDKHGVKTNIPKAAERLTGKPHVDHGKRKRINKRNGGSAAEHYLQHGYGPHKSSGIVLGGKKVGIQIK